MTDTGDGDRIERSLDAFIEGEAQRDPIEMRQLAQTKPADVIAGTWPTVMAPMPNDTATQKVGYVDESDVDLILVLDAHRNGPLTARLLAATKLTPHGPLRASRSTSRCGGTRETDVEIRWDDGSLLIEDKISASFTPGQPASYTQEVLDRRRVGEACAAVLVCPARVSDRYRAAAEDEHCVYVSFEELIEVAEEQGDPLSAAAALVLRSGIEQRIPPGIDPLAVAWGEGYQSVVAKVTPPGEAIRFSPSAFRSLTSDWVKLLLAGFPPNADGPWHWLPRGVVCVYVRQGPAVADLPPGATVTKAGKSWRIDLTVDVVSVQHPATDQEGPIRQAVEAGAALRRWCVEHPGSL
jgi:hypothetical protein